MATDFCACGCGAPTTPDGRGRPRRFIHGHAPRKPLRWEEEDRGYETPCWVWLGSTANGYPRVTRDGRTVGAHRLVYEETHGPIPDGLQLDHLCRVKLCVNPDHVEPVTCAENIHRGRATKLTTRKVAAIRRSGGTNAAVAKRHGVSATTVSLLRNGRLAWP